MSQTLELVKKRSISQELKPSQILRQTKLRQGKGTYHDRISNTYCAAGAIMHYFGYDGTNFEDRDLAWYIEYHSLVPGSLEGRIITLNDLENKSFTEIADILEREGL